jgi:simple sugar transport system ATP-binding protein
MVHQHFTLVPSMTVAENLALGGRGLLRAKELMSAVHETAQHTGFPLDPDARVESLSVGSQQRVEIAKAIARNPNILILDEPTAVLSPAEVDDFLRWLKMFAQSGRAVVLITHKLDEALAISDHITVMRHGHVVLSAGTHTLQRSDLTRAMLGEAAAEPTQPHPASPRLVPAVPPVFEARDVVVVDDGGRTRVHAANFVIHGGEIVGIAAIEGAGQHELLRALAGRLQIAGGTLIRPENVGYIPEDRHRDALMLNRSLTENVALRGAGARSGTLAWGRWLTLTELLIRNFDVRTPGPDVLMSSLSGGNQQKLVLARELAPPDVPALDAAVVADNPTRGLDIRASAEVHRRLREVASGGAAVVVCFSDIDDMLPLVSRVLVLRDGVLRETQLDRDVIGRAMIGIEE